MAKSLAQRIETIRDELVTGASVAQMMTNVEAALCEAKRQEAALSAWRGPEPETKPSPPIKAKKRSGLLSSVFNR